MSITEGTTDAADLNYAQAQAVLAVANTLNDLALSAWGLNVHRQGDTFHVDVHLDRQDVAGVDLFATHLHLGHDDQRDTNYTREGRALVYGHDLSVRVYCGRPDFLQVATS